MTRHISQIIKGAAAWNAWRDKNPNTHPNLSGANLWDKDLREANLSGANLSGANLSFLAS